MPGQNQQILSANTKIRVQLEIIRARDVEITILPYRTECRCVDCGMLLNSPVEYHHRVLCELIRVGSLDVVDCHIELDNGITSSYLVELPTSKL